jgi:hypothetical protein
LQALNLKKLFPAQAKFPILIKEIKKSPILQEDCSQAIRNPKKGIA